MILFTIFFTLGVWLLQQQATLPPSSGIWLLAGLPVILLIPTRTRPFRLIRALSIAVFACGIGFYHAAWQAELRLAESLPDEWQGRDIEVIGVVAELPRISLRGQRAGFDVEKTLTPGVTVPGHIYLSLYFDSKSQPLHAGERWQLTLRLKQVHGSSNPHGFDFELWALQNKVRATGYIHNKGHNIRLSPLAAGMHYRVESWRETVRDKINATLGRAPYTGVLTALAIGDQGSIPYAQWQIFTRVGVIHLMSISGLHITMLSGMAFAINYWLWRRSARLTLWLPARRAAAIAALLAAYSYALLAGFGVPAQRTVYMVGAVACALWLNRNFSLGQILSMAALAVLIPDPWAVLSPGFWLSFGAVALILYVSAHRINAADNAESAPSVKQRLWRLLREYAIVQWAMCIGLIPLLLALFGQVSLASPLANALAIPLVSLVVVPLTLAGAVLPTDVPLWLAHIALDGLMIPLQFLSAQPQAVWTQHIPPAWTIITGMLGALWILAPTGIPARALGLLLMLPMFLNKPETIPPGSLRIIIFDVGQGLSVAAFTGHHTLLYDTGPDYSGDTDSGNRILIPSLANLGISELDRMILSHNDIDHTGGTSSVLQALPTGLLISPHQPPSTPQSARASERCQDGMSWNWDGVQFDILHPGADRSHANDNSCVLRISTGNQHILLAGDIEWRGEQRLLREHPDQLTANLLVVPHHGSSSSSHIGFVAAVLPDYAVFTTGYRNRFGHPKAEIMQRYIDSGAKLLRSDRDGAILATMTPQGLTIERYRVTHRRYWTHQSD
ncbi:MAG: DNA internalization-related competence protein ComEC/Rec2 [Gallionella sp.]|nr:DNA internalization-related competence protein ComEC/Rec2 [Gallionella sp.]